MAIIVWQIFIFITIAISRKHKGWVAAFWVLWTVFQVFTLPLSILQFFTIFLAYTLTKSNDPKDVFADRYIDDQKMARIGAATRPIGTLQIRQDDLEMVTSSLGTISNCLLLAMREHGLMIEQGSHLQLFQDAMSRGDQDEVAEYMRDLVIHYKDCKDDAHRGRFISILSHAA